MADNGIAVNVHVYHFHEWCGEQLKRYHVQRPAPGVGYLGELVARVVAAVDNGHIPRGQYGAVMIDEGHDFEPTWLRLIVQMVDPDDGSLLLLYDDLQSIYKKQGGIDFSLASVGVQARGRTTVLKLNYRNTVEIVDFAYRFAKRYLSPRQRGEDAVPMVEPESAGRRGPPPHLKRLGSVEEEISFIVHTLQRLQRAGTPWRDMCIACHSKALGQRIANALVGARVPVSSLFDSASKKAADFSADTVKIMTMHSSKGLEFPLVVIPSVDALPRRENDIASEAKLLYVAMTRSTDKLLLTASNESEFVMRLAVG